MSLSRHLALAGIALLASTSLTQAEELTIATVNNSDMINMQKLSSKWEEATGNKLNWVVLEENVLRQRVTTDIATNGGQFDVVTIGSYEAPIWGAQGWLNTLDDLGDDYDYDDIFDSVRNGLSNDGKLFAVPFYAESSFTFYRKDLFDAAGIEMPEQMTYDQLAEFAAKLNDPDNGVYGTCQRGKAGWGENMAFVGPMVNTFGGRWFDMDWKPQLTSEPWVKAVTYYVDLMTKYGPPGASANGHNENRALFADGKCATWVDATSAAGFIYNPNESTVADKTAFSAAPMEVTDKGAGWFWAWALAIPSSSQKADIAKDFLKWSTSKDYITLVGETEGWVSAPPGTRKSTYANQDYIAAAPFAKTVEESILAANPADATLEPVPYTGIQYVAIPEFQGIGTFVGQQISAALAGSQTVQQALENSQAFAEREMTKAGYIK
ncbi:MAG: sugar ABC transporter substrate-binding protein [Geminicoccaceae bacterium]|nr:sugar ABC transporter substrate-binding protein [Geminicoccaceae bacterium]